MNPKTKGSACDNVTSIPRHVKDVACRDAGGCRDVLVEREEVPGTSILNGPINMVLNLTKVSLIK